MLRIDGPVVSSSVPWGSATGPDGEATGLVKEYDYVEEEFFVSGTAHVYGPAECRPLTPDELAWAVGPLSTIARPDVPYRTRVLVIRPREAARFSGTVHAVPFHNLIARAGVELDLVRSGHAWIGVEVCSGARFGRDEIPSGGVAHLHKVDPDRYGDLVVEGGDPADWGDLRAPGAVGAVFGAFSSFMEGGPALQVWAQEMFRSYAHGPDIFFQVVEGMRTGDASVLPGYDVRRVYSAGASGGSQILRALIEYHHDRHVQPDGTPAVDGYMTMVGVIPESRPANAVLVHFQTEAEIFRQIAEGREPPDDTDDPRFRYYEVPGTGHRYSAGSTRMVSSAQGADEDRWAISKVVPPGIQSLSDRPTSTEYEPYDKVNAPIVWALWDAVYGWVDDGIPMPRAPRITRDPATADGVARDVHANALGGLRTPWVDVPDATYKAQISTGDPLTPGMKRFSEEQMRDLYGTRVEYERRVRERLDDMVRDRVLLPQDRTVMFP